MVGGAADAEPGQLVQLRRRRVVVLGEELGLQARDAGIHETSECHCDGPGLAYREVLHQVLARAAESPFAASSEFCASPTENSSGGLVVLLV